MTRLSLDLGLDRRGYAAGAEFRASPHVSAWAKAEAAWKQWDEPTVTGGVRVRF